MVHTPAAPDTADLARRFVRETLGCGCPEETLARIGIEFRPGPPAFTELSVGGRLLVHIRACPGADRLPHLLGGWIAGGVAERDALGFNRFRLVLVAADPASQRPTAEALFAARGGDDRTHLHLVRPDEAGPLAPV